MGWGVETLFDSHFKKSHWLLGGKIGHLVWGNLPKTQMAEPDGQSGTCSWVRVYSAVRDS